MRFLWRTNGHPTANFVVHDLDGKRAGFRIWWRDGEGRLKMLAEMRWDRERPGYS